MMSSSCMKNWLFRQQKGLDDTNCKIVHQLLINFYKTTSAYRFFKIKLTNQFRYAKPIKVRKIM